MAESAPTDIGSLLGLAGWRQGAWLSRELMANLREELPAGAEVAMVVSQDCDLVRDQNTEPDIEVLCGRQVSALNNAYLFGRHHRVLALKCGDDSVVELDIRKRKWIPKSRLVAGPVLGPQNDPTLRVHAPDSNRQIEDGDVRMVAEWLASRYTRPAFPDAFNARISRNIEDKLSDLTKKPNARHVTGVYLDLGPAGDKDLPAGENYTALFWFTCSRDAFEANGSELEATREFARKYVGLMKQCTGINILEGKDGWEVRGEHQVSLDDLLFMRRFDYDHRTRAEGAH